MILKSVGLTKLIFYTLLFLLPVNLGLHFTLNQSYVGGLLVDYLVPTVYLQDIFAVFLLASWSISNFKNFKTYAGPSSFEQVVLLLFLLVAGLSLFMSPRLYTSLSVFLRLVLYTGVLFYTRANFNWKADHSVVTHILCFWLIVLGWLGLAQYYKQGSVFNNYAILGEQPYSYYTPLINKESVFGLARVPAYGLFRHPNIFGGFLVIALLWICAAYKNIKLSKKLFNVSFLFGFVSLLTTISYFSWLAFLLGVFTLQYYANVRLQKAGIIAGIVFITLALVIHVIPFTGYFAGAPSVYKRAELLSAGYNMLHTNRYVFGSGINTFTIFVEKYLTPTRYIRFVQPVHNIFILIAAELGMLGLGMFLLINLFALRNSYAKHSGVFVCLLALLVMASFDHYFITIHQTLLVYVFLLGTALSRRA